MGWEIVERPGYFGKTRDEKFKKYNEIYGEGNWLVVWVAGEEEYDFLAACNFHYEESYFKWLSENPKEVDFICSYGECIDNAMTNIQCGVMYLPQESNATHIQDIAVRRCLKRLGRKFEGPKDKVLVIRSKDSDGFRFGPGNIPFHDPSLIHRPTNAPKWANLDSVEDFWQSNKYIKALKPDSK